MKSALPLPDLPRVPRVDISTWRERIRTAPVTRFAPSPTGVLHLGHVVHAIFVWGIARAFAGTVILRFEDHDLTRCRPEYERAILEDLEWLGFDADGGYTRTLSSTSNYRQSDCAAAYQRHLALLGERSRVYACDCSRRTIRDLAGTEAGEKGVETAYPGTCRERGLAAGRDRGLRVILPDQMVEFDDVALGSLKQNPSEQCGDLLLMDRREQWTYQWSVVADDLRHGVSLVIRGDDLLPSTARQLMLHALLGSTSPPQHLHHPILLDATGRKLGKRYGAAGLAMLREAGITPSEVIGYAAYLGGLRAKVSSLGAADVGDLFVAP